MSDLTPGLSAEIEITVRPADTAEYWGSGLVPVYATPAMVGLMEHAAVQALAGHLSEGQTTVGGHIDVHHTAPTPVGMKVRAVARLVEVQDRQLTFHIEARDEVEIVGQAIHDRFIVDESRFTARAAAKGRETS
ncbi:MAG: thioesterase family protein [Anaerolineales bacterium]|nr:thioesterase family protein [Anaerolineales bacterium]